MNKTGQRNLLVKDKVNKKNALWDFKLHQDKCDELQKQILYNNLTMSNLDATNKRLTNEKVQLHSTLNALSEKKALLVQEVPRLKAALEKKQAQFEEEEQDVEILSSVISDLEQTVNQSNSETIRKDYEKIADKFKHIQDAKKFTQKAIAQLNTELAETNLQNQLAQQTIGEFETRNKQIENSINSIKSRYEETSNTLLKFREMLEENIEARLCSIDTNRQDEDTVQNINNNTWDTTFYEDAISNGTTIGIDWENYYNNTITNRGSDKINPVLIILGVGIISILVGASYYFIKKYFFSQPNNNSDNAENTYIEIEEEGGYLLPTTHHHPDAIPLIARTSKGLFVEKESVVTHNTIVNANETGHYDYPRGCHSFTEDDINNEAAYVNCLGTDTTSN